MDALTLISEIEAPLELALRHTVEQRCSDTRTLATLLREHSSLPAAHYYKVTQTLFILGLVRGEVGHFYPTEKGLQAYTVGLKTFFEAKRKEERLEKIKSAVAFILIILTFLVTLISVMR